MNLLLDTHVFLQYFAEPKKLSRSVLRILEGGQREVYVSAVTAWEMSIKVALGKLKVPGELSQYVRHRIREAGFGELPISIDHALAVRALASHHGDPFDRMLVAQAQVEGLAIVTGDEELLKYDVRTLPAYA